MQELEPNLEDKSAIQKIQLDDTENIEVIDKTPLLDVSVENDNLAENLCEIKNKVKLILSVVYSIKL